ncbi:hypothetical protein [Oleiagrimonas soli]|uniref:Uncharacterized protein n=1 Tax=Oleiagrimonas soli TaxID=1543381 RepID=A0A099CSY3_9GAMM|nr:hypothetical protein [Oleiagrimonas soli]KGI76894.1 hypothetical protein LF63_0113290 [Oleiagrimonas soli]MBB6185249.1 hypothetical protein [Oleiagrimonas soli]
MEKLSEIVTAIDAQLTETLLENFYAERKKLNGGNKWNGPLLQIQGGGKRSRQGYAFHKGGREELQFNVGFEDDGKYFRYGVAFSLEPSQDLPDPAVQLVPKMMLFNRLIEHFPKLLNLQMWVNEGDRSHHLPTGPIDSHWMRNGVFIFLGRRVRVPASGVPRRAIADAAHVLNMLWPLYEAIESEHSRATGNTEYKAARLCWNTNYWHSPSGREGKLTDVDTFEGEHGFGHEEWLFNHSTLIDGWKYGFIQALNRSQEKYQGQHLSLLLYAIDHNSKQRYWIGTIDDAEVLTKRDARRISHQFRKEGWLRAMREEVRSLELNPATLNDAETLVNVRYRPESLHMFDDLKPFPYRLLKSARYGQLQRLVTPISSILEESENEEESSGRNLSKTKATRHVSGGSYEVDLIQTQWQQSLENTLSEDVKGAKVDIERTVGGHRVDVVLALGKREIFIELKTFGPARKIIRDALSQLMEYAYWPDKHRCQTLLIVGPSEAGVEANTYLAMLRKRFGLPVHYLPYRNGRIAGIADWLKTLPE